MNNNKGKNCFTAESQRSQREKIFSFVVERDDKGKTLSPASAGPLRDMF